LAEDSQWKEMAETNSRKKKRIDSWIAFLLRHDVIFTIGRTLIEWAKKQSSRISLGREYHRKRSRVNLKERLKVRQ
jgi:hypothetical protein